MKHEMTNRVALPAARTAVLPLALGSLLLGLAGCAGLPEAAPAPALRDAASLGIVAPVSGAAASAAAMGPWWKEFGDTQLNALVEQALAGNPGLQVAQARLDKAQAAAGLARTAGMPQLNAALDLTHQRYTANGAVPPPLAGSVRDSGTLQLAGSWELDFFGKNQAVLYAALGTARAADADAQAARVLLSSSVVRTYVQLARNNAQLALARRMLAQREETLTLVRDRVAAGLDTRLEQLQSSGALPEARVQIETLQEQLALGRNALAALVGQPQLANSIVVPDLARLNIGASAAAIPADLLGRRADIVAARWRVEAATQDVAQARTQFYPNINLVAFAGLSSIGLDRLLQSGSQQWGAGPALRLPLFDAGRLRANLRGRSADLDAAVASYNATLIDAVHEVADQLASGQSIARQQDQQRAAQAAAEGAYEIALQRYKAGLGNYLFVLTAETNVLSQRRAATDLVARSLDTQVALIRALGGDYVGDKPVP